jgi:hypothetical protein
MRILHGLATAVLLAPAALIATKPAEAAGIDYCVGGPINVGYGYTGSIASCTIPYTGTYRLTAYGADGGDGSLEGPPTDIYPGGKGAAIAGRFLLEAGDVLTILVGGRGQSVPPQPGTAIPFAGGGGGGSFIALQRGGGGPVPLLIAGGGSGGPSEFGGQDGRALEDSPGVPSGAGKQDGAGAGGSAGSGGGGATAAGGGAGGGGFSGDGGNGPTSTGGLSFLNGGAGGTPGGPGGCIGAAGGFGGGGAGACSFIDGAGSGGGGGYSGGGGGGQGNFLSSDGGAGGGGSSWYNPPFALDFFATAGGNIFGDGQIQIQWLTNADGTPVPEPGSLALLATGVLLLAQRRARSQRPD